MSSFTNPLDVRISADGRSGTLLAEFEYHVGTEDSIDVVRVPVGFETDFASSPWPVWWLIPPWGRYSKAAVIHDRLYATKERTRKEADAIFREAMCVLKVAPWKCFVMYWSVRIWGGIAWRGRSGWL